MLESADSFAQFKAALTGNPALAVDAMREADYYRQQSQAFSRLLSTVAYLIGGIMAVGAVSGALNAMYSAVSTRMVEIATLRVLGFGASAVVVSVFAEALLLAILGGAVEGCLAWLLFNGHAVSTNGGGLTQLSVPLAVDLNLIGFGVLWACIIGMVGAAFPAIRAARTLGVCTAWNIDRCATTEPGDVPHHRAAICRIRYRATRSWPPPGSPPRGARCQVDLVKKSRL
jgi:putative ABC transport system permease protein